MKPSASEKSCDSCLSSPSRAGSVVAGEHRHRRGADGAAQRRDPPEDVGAQFLEFAGEAHDVDQRRAQIVADDIGEALDFVVGLAQVGGALVDGGLEVEVVVAQLRFGLVAGARRAPHQEDRDGGQRDHEAGAGDGHDRGELLGAIGGRRAQREQPVFFRAHRVGDVADASRSMSPAAASRSIATPPRDVVALTKSIALANSASRACDRRAQFADCFDLNRVVGGQPGELVEVGRDGGHRGVVFGEKSGPGGQQIAARGAFGAADFQQQGVDLVFDLDGVHHPGIVLAGLVDEDRPRSR